MQINMHNICDKECNMYFNLCLFHTPSKGFKNKYLFEKVSIPITVPPFALTFCMTGRLNCVRSKKTNLAIIGSRSVMR